MKISTRIILVYLVSIILGFVFLLQAIVKDLKPRYREAVEESLVDTAQILAAHLSAQSKAGEIRLDYLDQSIRDIKDTKLNAKIYELKKKRVDIRVYVSDRNGKLIYHSENPAAIGSDYSRWNDVYLSLKGKYGARTTRDNPKDPLSTVLYIAAPIKFKDKIIGSLTVAKPTTITNYFIQDAQNKLIFFGVITAVGIMIFSSFIAVWISRPIEKLSNYVRELSLGKKVNLPNLGRNEIGQLGNNFEEMRRALEGRKYIENYVQTLTHEVKSPLSVISGAAELLQEQDLNQRNHDFVQNILAEAKRIENIVNRLLSLSAIESKDALQNPSNIDLVEIIKDVCAAFEPVIEKNNIKIQCDLPESAKLLGDEFLLAHGIRNIIQNAIEFSPTGGQIDLTLEIQGDKLQLRVRDQGAGIPEWAKDKVFEKFFSLPRSKTGRKSSGLGLSFLKRVVELHGGEVEIESNGPEKGCQILISLPSEQTSHHTS